MSTPEEGTIELHLSEEYLSFAAELEETFLNLNTIIVDYCEALILEKMHYCSSENQISSPHVSTAIKAAFLSTLEQDEGRSFPFVIKYHSDTLPEPYELRTPITIDRFEVPLPLDPKTISKLAPAILPTRKAILISIISDELRIIGIGDTNQSTLMLSSLRQGTLAIDFKYGKYPEDSSSHQDYIHRIAFLTRTRSFWKPDLERMVGYSDWKIFNSGLSEASFNFRLLALGEILKRIYCYQRGAIVVITADTDWRNGTTQGNKFSITADKPKTKLSSFKNDIRKFGNSDLVNDIATASRIDGAIILDSNFSVLAFGAKLGPLDTKNIITEVAMTDPSWRMFGEDIAMKPISEVGGMRHQSSSQFAYDMRKSHVITVSEDGPITWQFWSDKVESVVLIKNAESFIL